MKLLFEIYRILRELGIKTKDIIGVGKSLQKTGTKLFKENIDPKILEVIYNKGTLSDKIKKIITEAAKGLRDTNAIEKRKFLVNIRQIKNAVFPQEAEVIDIATRAKIPASGIEKLKTRIQLDKNVLPFKEGEARWILNKALKEDAFAFAPEEIKMIKGGKGDIRNFLENTMEVRLYVTFLPTDRFYLHLGFLINLNMPLTRMDFLQTIQNSTRKQSILKRRGN